VHLSAIDCDHFKPSHQITAPHPSIAAVLVRTKSIPVSVIGASVTQTTRSRAWSGHWLPFMQRLQETTGLKKQQGRLRIGSSKNLGKTGADEHPDWRSVTARAAHSLALRTVERHPYC